MVSRPTPSQHFVAFCFLYPYVVSFLRYCISGSSTVFRQWAPWLVKGQRAPAGGLLCQLAGVAGHRVVLFSWRPLCLGSAACRALRNESILFVRNCLLGLGSGDRLITCHSKGVLECLADGSEGLSGPQNCLQR